MWDLDGNESATFRLQSPGISVCWHPKEVFKVGVAYSKSEVKPLSSIDGLQLEGQVLGQLYGCPHSSKTSSLLSETLEVHVGGQISQIKDSAQHSNIDFVVKYLDVVPKAHMWVKAC